jgi:hypothetical protein
MHRLALAISGILLLGAAGAFFLYVSALSIIAVLLILASMMLMFLLGLQAATQMIPAAALSPGNMLRRLRALGSRTP